MPRELHKEENILKSCFVSKANSDSTEKASSGLSAALMKNSWISALLKLPRTESFLDSA